jgi:hypothetical protein
MHSEMASALASQHRHDMTAKASRQAQAVQAAQAGGTAEARQDAPGARGALGVRTGRPQAATSPRGPRRGARRPHLPGPLPRYRVSWSRTALSTAAADGARRGRSWVIVISATRGL